MRRSVFLSGLIVLAMFSGVAEAGPRAVVTADVDTEVVEQVFDAGDIVAVPLCITSEAGAAIFGVDLDLAVSTR